MGELRFVATATRKVAAPREAILGFELDPLNASRVEPRIRVANIETGPDGRPKAWKLEQRVAKVFRLTARALVMSIDPVILEVRNNNQVQISTSTVSSEPDADGRFTLTYTVEAIPKKGWLLRLNRDRIQAEVDRDINRQIDAAVAILEADARTAAA